MFTIFKQKQNKSKSIEAIIDEIHNEFNTSSDKLLQEAKAILEGNSSVDSQKAERLVACGFESSQIVKQARKESIDKEKAKHSAKLVTYWNEKYPLYKFITSEKVEEICKKYNLIQGPVDKYTGFVPEKNLREIENFKKFTIHDEDCTYYSVSRWSGRSGSSYRSYKAQQDEIYEQSRSVTDRDEISRTIRMVTNPEYLIYKDTRFQICAPQKEMNMQGYKVENHKMVKYIPDPVVLFPVKDGFLIVTAWGDEASDPDVVNQNMN